MLNLYEHQRRGLEETADKNRVVIAGYEGLYSVDKNGNVYKVVIKWVISIYLNTRETV